MPIVNNITRLLDQRKIAYRSFELPAEKLGARDHRQDAGGECGDCV